MTTSGATAFDLNLNELIEEAFERAGAEVRTGYEFKTARRSLNLLTIEWANLGINLWLLEQGQIPLTQGIFTYNLPADTIDLLDQVVRTGTGQSQQDINISRISSTTYSVIPSKNAQGRPIQVWVDRQSGASYSVIGVQPPRIILWPVPDQTNFYTFVYWRLRRIQDAGTGITTQDIPFRFLPALVAGLAYYIAMKIPEGYSRLQDLKAVYNESLQLAMAEDREKATARFVPHLQSWR